MTVETIINIIMVLDLILVTPMAYELYEIVSLETKKDFDNFNYYIYFAILINLPMLFIK